MDSHGWYGVDARKVAHETIDGEVIMIHLVLGNYFSLDGLGADLWEMLARGQGRDATLELLEQRYEAEPELIASTVHELLRRLTEEELIEAAPADANGAAPPEWEPGEKRPFKAPELQKYTDMQDFLLVDPIHEVDESGWPNPQQAA